MPDQAYQAAFDALPKFTSPSGEVRRSILETDGATVQFTWVDAGGRLAPPGVAPGEADRHPFDQTHIVISGRLEMTLYEDGGTPQTYTLGPGEILYIPGGVPHAGRCLGDEPLFAIELFAPARADMHDMARAHQPGLPEAL
jgi:mannose-6-phosphate isomerase-like protein (cupin superfamily)